MKLHIPCCPICGASARGTVERLSGVAEFGGTPLPGEHVEYSGWTDIWWDEQRTVHQKDGEAEGPDNLPIVCCPEGHTWATAIDW